MNGQEIIEMAKQAGLLDEVNGWDVWFPDELQDFAKLVAAKEREACAKVCEDASKPHDGEMQSDAQWAGLVLATTIRARK